MLIQKCDYFNPDWLESGVVSDTEGHETRMMKIKNQGPRYILLL